MDSREQRIATLATTLRSSGIAKSDSQAKMMAEDMIGVEEHVQKSYEVENTRATEYLQTAKNLGNPRQTIKPEPISEKTTQGSIQGSTSSRRIEPLPNTNSQTNIPSNANSSANSRIAQEYTDVNFGGRTLNQAQTFDHDTHNSALEAIKAQIGRTQITPLEDMNQDLESEQPEHINMLEPKSEPITSARLAEIKLPEVKLPETSQENISTNSSEIIPEEPKEAKLDAQKLIDMMEEDGNKMEEHTREIKEKPKDAKPKEAYEENNIDLGNVFNFNKR